MIASSELFRFAAAADRAPFHEMKDAEGRTQVWAVARSPSVRDTGLYIMVGLSKDGLVAAANRRLYEDMAMLAVASLLLLAGVWLLATLGVGRQVGRLAAMARRLGLGDLSARIPRPHPRGELGGLMTLLNDTAGSLSASAPPSTNSTINSASPRRWRRWASSPAAWRTISTIC